VILSHCTAHSPQINPYSTLACPRTRPHDPQEWVFSCHSPHFPYKKSLYIAPPRAYIPCIFAGGASVARHRAGWLVRLALGTCP